MPKKAKILIAEDDEPIRELMRIKVSEAGYDVVAAEDGEQATKLIEKENPDVIILDLKMPKKDGLEIIKSLRMDTHRKERQPIIVVTGRDDISSFGHDFFIETDFFIQKPFDEADLLKAIRILLQLKAHDPELYGFDAPPDDL